jgi:hypothetical protein
MVGVLEFDSRRELGIFLFTTASRTALGPTQPPIQWVPGGGVFPWGQSGRGVKLTTHLHLVPRSKNAWSYTSIPPIHLQFKHRENFTFTFTTQCETHIAVQQMQAATPPPPIQPSNHLHSFFNKQDFHIRVRIIAKYPREPLKRMNFFSRVV